MKCYLHIGTEKTGTTSIQQFFNINRSRLLEKGFMFTESVGADNNRSLSVAAYDLSHYDDFTASEGFDTNEKLKAFQEQFIAELETEINGTRASHPHVDTIVFSSEHVHSRLTRANELQRLKEILHRLGIQEIQIIVYLRRPAELANSLYIESIKAGYNLRCWPPEEYYDNVCNHRNTLSLYSSVFGQTSITPRLFNRQDLVNESIIDDITSVMGIPRDSYACPGIMNKGISMLGLEILKRLNKRIPAYIDNKPNCIRAELASYIVNNFSDDKYIMPSDLFEKYDLRYHDSNEWIRQHYFKDKQELFPTDIPQQSSLNMQQEDLDKIAGLIASIWSGKQLELLELAKRLIENSSDRI
jgi:hypothetical protein